MEITKTPVILAGLQRLMAEQANDASKRFLPDRSFDLHPMMIEVLVHILDSTPQELHQKMLQKFEEPDFEVQTTVAD